MGGVRQEAGEVSETEVWGPVTTGKRVWTSPLQQETATSLQTRTQKLWLLGKEGHFQGRMQEGHFQGRRLQTGFF